MKWRNALIVLMTVLVFYSLWKKQRETVAQKRLAAIAQEQATHPHRKSKVRALVPSASAASPDARDYQALIEADAFCEVVNLDGREGNRPMQLLRALGLARDSRFAEMAADNNPLFSDPTGQVYSSPLARFLQALRLSGDIEGGRRLQFKDAQKAWNLLTELHRDQPTNAAFLVFRLGVEYELDYPLEQRFETAREIMQMRDYDSLESEFYREVFERARDNSTKVIAGLTFLTTLPVPSYNRIKQGVRELEMEVPGLSDHVGRLMTRPGLDAQNSTMTGGYSSAEYNVGKDLAPWLDVPTLDQLESQKRRPRGDFSDFVPSDQGACTEEYHQHVRATLQTWF